MSATPSIMSLHLGYRLWIAQMNFDINVLRIFNDYLGELSSKKDESEANAKIEYFVQQFPVLRKEIDELRNEMHLLKMELASYSRERKQLDYKTYLEGNHETVKERYQRFRKNFDKFRKEFESFEVNRQD